MYYYYLEIIIPDHIISLYNTNDPQEGSIMKIITFFLGIASAVAFSAPKIPRSSFVSAVSRKDFVDGAVSVAAISLLQPSSVRAADNIPPINGIYADPNHKNGYRVVRTVGKSSALVTLQDEPGGPIITVSGDINTTGKRTTVTLDLSPKGGPKDVVATVKGSDLYFPDGNSWTKNSGIDGIYSDPNHPDGYRIVRTSSGGNVMITLQDGPSGPVVELVGIRASNGDILIDFSPKGGPKDLSASFKDDKLVFPDGNAWPKL